MNGIEKHQANRMTSYVPLNIMVEVTSRCNLVCPMCPRQHGKRKQRADGDMSMENFKRIVDQMKPERMALFYSGEPLLNQNFFDMCRYAKHDAGITFIKINTNGVLLSRGGYVRELVTCGLDKVVFSLECNADIHAEIRGSNYNQVKDNIVNAIKEKNACNSNTVIEIQHLITSDVDKNDITQSEMYWLKLGVKVGTASVSGLAGQVPDLGDTRPQKKTCKEIWTNLIVAWNGDVTHCCVDHAFQLKFGNILEEPLSGVWRNGKAEWLRRCHEDNKELPALCKQCLIGNNA